MPDIFGRADMSWGGGLVADKGVIKGGAGLDGVLMQNINVTYQRPITKLYELGEAPKPTKVYYVEGRPQGSLTIGRIIAFSVSVKTFYTTYGNACNAKGNTLTLDLSSALCDPAGAGAKAQIPVQLIMRNCVLTSVGFSVQAQQLVVNENSAMEFSNMEYKGP